MRLKDISEIKLGYSDRKEPSSGDFFYISPKDIDMSYKINTFDLYKVDMINYDNQILEAGEVLLISRGRFAATAFDNSYVGKFIANAAFLRIKITNPNILPKYLALYLNSSNGQKSLQRLSGSILYPAITKSQLEDFKVPLVSIEKQKKLINLLDEFNHWNNLHQRQSKLQQILINSVINKETGAKNG